jgi:alpha-mannosidase
MKTVHLVGNAHLDPVWLWRRSDGVDTALATVRSACDRLDEYAELVFTASASWLYEQAETLDPALFDRVRAHVAAGRWAIVGGMVIQPDCNLPSAESFARQLAVGQAYCRRTFGRPTTVGYNVDSFGHTAYLPRFLREAGIDTYVFMRPGPPPARPSTARGKRSSSTSSTTC